ncbi:D-alanyl-D-alanine carboxypeptidase family protein [Salirhabdus salicampi]|uniref:D-alanyl-D-alanine carboxypeptidase family protein n=1 Tax=Salirhabdus salicampi TaxID=476102 RepID=UPI0020C44872|nr:D-alanyl-D-alanine carboxypeptidase family protein [Salirhabdus salicampi]MCP8616766.1 D-alanyl-D-alanine carboxypeptidase [Salirhabdus salicampi]
MKKITALMITLSMLVSFPMTSIFAEESNDLDLAEHSKSAILMEKDTGKVLYTKNADKRLPPASMTKIMTLILIMEALEKGTIKLDEKVRISEHAASMGGSQIFLEAGEEMTVHDLLKGVAIASGNDASVALAERIAGSEKAFVKLMNEKVKQLGLKDTQFQNTTGLPAKNHYSTAKDLAIMAKELLKHQKITEYTSIYDDYLRKGTEDEFWLVNTNKLVKFYKGVDGLKTGYTNEAKYCLTATAKRGDMRVIAVAMGADTTKKRNRDITTMLDYAFHQFETKPLYKRFDVVDQLSMINAQSEKVDVVTSDNVSLLLKKGENAEQVKKEIKYDKGLKVPMKKGDRVGVLQIKNGDKVLSETPLVLKDDMKTANIWTLLKRSFKEFVKS